MATHFIAAFTHRLTQLYSKLMPIPCRLCGTACQSHAICNPCMDDLPLLGPACPRCAHPITRSQLCGQCLSSPPEQDISLSLFRYQEPITQLIADLKYHNRLNLCTFFAHQMSEQLANNKLPELLIPIPLHPNRLVQRGYNQSLILAKALSKNLSIPISNEHLIRTIDTQSQSSIAYKQRKNNIKHAFKLINNKLPAHIALIDDVLTTGHTANAAAKLLRQAGVETIEVWTIARTLRHH